MIKLLVTQHDVDYSHLHLKELIEIIPGTSIHTISQELYTILEGSIILLPKSFLLSVVIYKDSELFEWRAGAFKPCDSAKESLIREFKARLGIKDYDYIINTVIDMLNDDSIALKEVKEYLSEQKSNNEVEPGVPQIAYLEANVATNETKAVIENKPMSNIARKLMDLSL